MSSEAFLGSSRTLADHLLAGTNPRCIWTAHGRKSNAAFDIAFPRSYVPEVRSGVVDAYGFRCTLTPLVLGGEDCVFIDGVPIGATQCNSLLDKLPEIVRCVTKPDPGIVDVHRFMDVLSRADTELFTGLRLFLSRAQGPFVQVREIGDADVQHRSWLRWPMSRLFANRRACIITNPYEEQRRGLAVPFTVAPAQRFVVLAAVRPNTQFDAAQSIFIQTLESLVLGPPQQSQPTRAFALDSVRAEPMVSAPSLMWFGSDGDLKEAVNDLLQRRGWELKRAGTFGAMLKALDEGIVDVVLLDGSNSQDPLVLLRAIRHTTGVLNVPVIYFDAQGPKAEVDVLADRHLSRESPPGEIFKAVKDVLRLVPERRFEALRAAVNGFSSSLERCEDSQSFAHALATAACEIAGEWASVTLADHASNLWSAEWPNVSDEPLMDQVPLTFLSGYAVMRSTVDEVFFAEISYDRSVQENLKQLRPLSGASVPISYGGRITGTMLVLSSTRRMFDPEFDALTQLADLAARCFAELQTRMLRRSALTDTGGPLWTHIEIGDCAVDAYQGERSPTAIRVATLGEGALALVAVSCAERDEDSTDMAEHVLQEIAAALERTGDEALSLAYSVRNFESEPGAVLAAIANFHDERFAYNAVRFPLPLQVPLHGPAPILQSDARSHQGVMTIQSRTVTLVYTDDVARSVDSATMMTMVQRELRRGSANPAHTLPSLAANPHAISFVAVTRRPFDAV